MRLRLKHPVCIRPDPNGEYPEIVGKRLIAAGLATLETASLEIGEKRGRGRPRKEDVK
jgi:hypothetical protein